MIPKRSFWQKSFRDLNQELIEFFQYSWPVNWSKLFNLKTLSQALVFSPYSLKIGLVSFLIFLLISGGLMANSSYYLLTTEVATQGGEFREVVLQDKIERLNPVLQASSEAERKITSLLFHPLYKVEFPDFLRNPLDEPKITPVLLEKNPEWSTAEEDQTSPFRVLKFELRGDIKWSDGTPITTKDISYSFERLKEERGNSEFKEVFTNYELVAEPNSTTKFEIRPNKPGIGPNPQLLYLANFSPVSATFFEEATNADLYTSFRSLQPAVSSGYFKFPLKVKDPDSINKQELDNPIRKGFENYSVVVLERNPQENAKETIYLDRFIVKVVDQLEDKGGDKSSLKREATDKRIDLFNRFLTPSSATSESIRGLTGLNQKILPTNSFFSLYLNIQSSGGGLDGYFINQSLRKYLICNLVNFEPSETARDNLDILPLEKRLLPLQLGESFVPEECATATDQLLNEVNSRNTKIYNILKDETSQLQNVQVFGNPVNLTFLALEEFYPFAEIVQNRLQEIGLPVTVVWTNARDVENALAQKNYHMVLLPLTVINQNLYPILGAGGKNISNIIKNERVNGKTIEANLKTFSDSNSTDLESKNQLLEFFKTQFVGVNLFRLQQEVNYSTRVANLENNLPEMITFPVEYYNKITRYYTETRRKLR